jgi:methionyl-tRNA formyltransferase
LVISSCGPSDLYLVREVAARFPICGIIRPVATHGRRLNWKNILKRPLKLLNGAANQRISAYRSRKTNAWVSRILFSESAPELPENVIDIPNTAINAPTTVARISALAPDLILACGAPVLAPEIFNIPRLASINIHFGIAPNYRGEHTLLWPLRIGDYQNIGITIHHIDEGIDTGRPLVRGYPSLETFDTEKSIVLKCIRMAPGILMPILENMVNTGSAPLLKPVETARDGIFIRYQDRKLSHDLTFNIRRYLGRVRPPDQSERIEKLYLQDF